MEAGLTALLVLAGVSADQAAVGTLLYRLASYWLPIPLGALAMAGWQFRHRLPDDVHGSLTRRRPDRRAAELAL